MELFHMIDIISLLGLPFPAHGQSSYYIQCPCCDGKDPKKQHLNINLRKEVFRCPKCGVSGGILDLYALATDTPRRDAYKNITARLGRPEESVRAKNKVIPPIQIFKEYPLTDIETRHATYCALLAKLSLSNDHRLNLLARGLTDEDIERIGYKTTPLVGMINLAKKMQSEGFYLAGVPGFYRNEFDSWTFMHEKRGILIPVRNMKMQIQGLQVRLDDVKKRKFRWISTGERKDGCKTEGWTHLAGPVSPQMILTEGPMKADVIYALTGRSVLAVPGVNSLNNLKIILEELKEQGLQEIKTAFDMDFLTNYHVQNGFKKLLELLDEMDFKFGTYLWNPAFKGLDDYIWASKQQG